MTVEKGGKGEKKFKIQYTKFSTVFLQRGNAYSCNTCLFDFKACLELYRCECSEVRTVLLKCPFSWNDNMKKACLLALKVLMLETEIQMFVYTQEDFVYFGVDGHF